MRVKYLFVALAALFLSGAALFSQTPDPMAYPNAIIVDKR